MSRTPAEQSVIVIALVMGDFNSRRGRIMGIDSAGKLQIVKAQCPLSEMFRYAILLRSMTSGRGSFSMEYSHYEEVPQDIAKKVIAQAQPEKEAEEEWKKAQEIDADVAAEKLYESGITL